MYFLIAILLFILWCLFSGQASATLAFIGILSTIFSIYIYRKLKITELVIFEKIKISNFLSYLPFLIKEIFLSAINMSKIIWGYNLTCSPVFGPIKTNINSNLGKFIFVNSITLTPGTISVKLDKDTIFVHAIEKKSFYSITDSEMERKIINIFYNKTSKLDD